MKALLVARDEEQVIRMVSLLRDEGLDAMGTTSGQEAVSEIETDDVGAIVIGAGVNREARARLLSLAVGRGLPVIDGALHGRDPRAYAEQELVPQLRTAVRER